MTCWSRFGSTGVETPTLTSPPGAWPCCFGSELKRRAPERHRLTLCLDCQTPAAAAGLSWKFVVDLLLVSPFLSKPVVVF